MAESQPQPFTSDAPLFYNVKIWGERGYAVPNFGRNQYTVNETIDDFTKEGGKRLSIIMHDEDAMRGDPPSLNSIILMIQFCNRARQLVLGRAISENELKMKSTKVTSERRPYVVFPCPFFKVANPCMRKFASLAFATLAELMQSTESAVSFDITTQLAETSIKYVQRFYVQLAMEYFNLSDGEARAPELDLMEHLAKYTPTLYGYMSVERLGVTGHLALPQEYDLGELATGILVPNLPPLGPYPWPDLLPGVESQPQETQPRAGSGDGVRPVSNVTPFPDNKLPGSV